MSRLSRGLLGLMLLVSLVGCGGALAGPETPSPVDEARTFTYPGEDWGYPTPFAMYPRGPGYLRMSYLFDTLTWKDAQGVIPWLAETWSVDEGGRTWRFTLRGNVTWHDGQPLTAQDVAFTFDYLKAHRAAFAWTWPVDKVARVEAVDERTVTFELTEPVAGFLVDLAGSVPILPAHVWRDVTDPGKFLGPEAVVGSGPFRLTAYVKEEGRYIYAANPDYFLGRPVVETLVFNAVQDEALALKTGTVDGASFWGKEIEVVREFEGDDAYAVKEGPSFWVLQLIFNTERAPFSDGTVRRAAAYAVDRERLVEQVTHGGAVVANLGVVSPRTDWAHPNLPAYDHDASRARALLEEAGAAGAEVTLITTANFAREAELIQADLNAVGLSVALKSGDRSTVDGLLREGNFDLALNGHGGIGNPSILRTPTWPASGYQNADYDRLFAQQAQTVDEAARRELVWQLQEILAGDLPVLTLYHPKMWAIYDPTLVEPFYTAGGIGFGIPIELNKLVFLP